MLTVFALALYAPSLGNDLTNWDDLDYTTKSPFVTEGLRGAADAFTVSYRGAYIPLTHAVLTVTGAANPANPLPYHLVQWLLFGVAVLLLPRALSAFGLSRAICLGATALWLAHPFRVESVSWVGNLKDTLSLVLAAGAFAAYASERRWLSTALFVLGLLGKASLAPLAPFFLVLEWRHHRRLGAAALSSLRWAVPAVVAGLYAVVVHRAFLPTQYPVAPTTPLFTPFWYLGRTLWPSHPRAIYEWVVPTGLTVAGAIVGWVVVVGLAVAGFRPRAGPMARGVAWGLLAFLVPLVPFSGVFPQAQVVAERYTLFPALVLAIGVAAVLTRLRLAGGVLLGLLTFALAVPNVLRQREWRDAETLWASNLEVSPGSVTVHLNLAGALGGVGKFDEALAQLLLVRKLDPRYPNLDCFVAMARAGKERLPASFAVTELGALCQLPASQRWASAAPILARKDATTRLLLDELAFGADRAKAAQLAAGLALEANEFERAFNLATQARLWDATLDRAVVTQVIALLKLKRLDEAELLTQTPVKDEKVEARLLGLKGAVLHERGQYAEAEALLRESTERLKLLGDRP